MKTLSLLSLLFISTALFSQDGEQRVYVIQQQNAFLIYGDLNFTKDFQGIRQFMEILAQEDPSMFQKMAPRYEGLQQQRTTAIGLAAGTAFVGTALVLHWAGQQIENAGDLGAPPNYGSLIAGTVFIIGSAGLYRAIYNPDRELLGFVNDFNRQTEGVKLRLTGNLAPVGGRWHGGIGVHLQF